jgi:hypothetical protein
MSGSLVELFSSKMLTGAGRDVVGIKFIELSGRAAASTADTWGVHGFVRPLRLKSWRNMKPPTHLSLFVYYHYLI